MGNVDVIDIMEKSFELFRQVAQFEKVSYEQFKKDVHKIDEHMSEEKIKYFYDKIELPKRATVGSAGYDFFNSIFDFSLRNNETITIPTGIRCNMNKNWVLVIVPRSGLGFKYRIQLDNTLGIIDSDYFYSDNEGHIMIRITNDSIFQSCCNIENGQGFCQGIFLPYGITKDDDTDGIRNGGFGSTNKK